MSLVDEVNVVYRPFSEIKTTSGNISLIVNRVQIMAKISTTVIKEAIASDPPHYSLI